MVRRYTRKLHRGGATYLEQQNMALCGKHALNHVLQEAKFIWDDSKENQNTLYIPKVPKGENPTAHVKKNGVQVNLVAACKEYENYELKKRFDKFYPTALDDLVKRLFLKIEEEDAPIKIPAVGSSERKQAKYADKTDKQIEEMIKAGRVAAFEKSQKLQKAEREKYKEFLTVDEEGEVIDINREGLDKKYRIEWKADDRKTMTTEGTACQSSGNIIPEILTRWVNILGYKGFPTTINDVTGDVSIYENNPAIYLDEMLKVLPLQLEEPGFLGVLLGRLGDREGHYTSIVMYDEECAPTRKDEPDSAKKLYSYIDSVFVVEKDGVCALKKNVKQCFNQKDLLKKVETFKPTCMIFVFAYDNDDNGALNPYQSVAYRRMEGLETPESNEAPNLKAALEVSDKPAEEA